MGAKTHVVVIGVVTFLAGFFLAKSGGVGNLGVTTMDVTTKSMKSGVVGGGTRIMSQVVPNGVVKAAVVAVDDSNKSDPGASKGGSTKKSSSSSKAVTSGFDKIIKTAYRNAVKPLTGDKAPKRNKFDIDFWEKESGLTTNGGLMREDRILLAEVYSHADSVFEFGLGESTYLANYVGVPRYAGIDSDPVWVDMARNRVSGHFRFYFGDIGKTGPWGIPEDKTLPKNVLDYQLEPLIVEQEAFEVYMVDGRYRMACALACFLHASARGADTMQTTVLIHDCEKEKGGLLGSTEGRDIYHSADHLLNMINHSGSKLCIFKRKPGTTDDQLVEVWTKLKRRTKR